MNNHHLDSLCAALEIPLPTPEQAEIISSPLESFLVIAGAGSGKTSTIALRIINLIISESVSSAEVIGLTFTRKAAVELKHRIHTLLTALVRVGYCDARLVSTLPVVQTYHSYALDIVRNYGVLDAMAAHISVMSETQLWFLARDIIHAHAGQMLALLAQRISRDSKYLNRSVASMTEDLVILKSKMADKHITPAQLMDQAVEFNAAVEAWSARGEKITQDVQDTLDSSWYRAYLAKLIDVFREHNSDQPLHDYDEIIYQAGEITRSFDYVTNKERSLYRAVFLDEYQDTSDGQRHLLTNIFATNDPVPARGVMAVGDPLQSIYGWRGASTTNLLHFPTDFQQGSRPTPVRYLSHSWRNPKAVLELANHVATELRTPRLPAPTLQPAPQCDEGIIALSQWEDRGSELNWVVTKIADALSREPGSTAAILIRQNGLAQEVAQACYAQGVRCHIVGNSGLLELPFIVDIVSLLHVIASDDSDVHAVRLLTSHRWNMGARDLASLAQARKQARPPRFAHGDKQTPENEDPATIFKDRVEEVISAHYAPAEPSLVSIILYSDPAELAGISTLGLERLAEFKSIILAARRILVFSWYEALQYGIAQFNISESLWEDNHYAEYVQSNIDTFVLFAAQKFRGGMHSVHTFLQYCAVAVSQERGLEAFTAPVKPDSVAIMTIHAAKGLEFDHIALAGVSRRIFPSAKPNPYWASSPRLLPAIAVGSAQDNDELPIFTWPVNTRKEFSAELKLHKEAIRAWEAKEELKLWYVAITRSARSLFLSGSGPEVSEYLLAAKEWLEQTDRAAAIEQWYCPDHNEPRPPEPPQAAQLSWPDQPSVHVSQQRQSALRIATIMDLPDCGAPSEFIQLVDRISRLSAPAQEKYQLRAMSVAQLATLMGARAKTRKGARTTITGAQRQALGTYFHTWIENYSTQTELLAITQLPGAADQDNKFHDMKDLTEKWRDNFLNSPWGSSFPSYTEFPFVYYCQGVSLVGRIDAIYARDNEHWDIVDWKTGAIPVDVSTASHPYAYQVALYKLAWSRLKNIPLDNIHTYLYFVEFNETVRVDLVIDPQMLRELVEYYHDAVQ